MDWHLYYPGASDDAVNIITRIITRLIPKRVRKYPLERVVAAILYRIDNGCKWRALDRGDYLPWHVAYDYFRRWTRERVVDRCNALIVKLERRRQNRASGHVSPSEPTTVVIDAQAAPSNVWGERASLGYDGFKRVKGISRHVATDLRGHVLACKCSGANEHESRRVEDLLIEVREAGFTAAETVVADGGYRGCEDACASEGFELEVVKRSDYGTSKSAAKRKTFKPLPRRWVIERTFGYLRFNRVLSKCYERLDACAETVVLWANIRTLTRRWQKL